MQKVEIYTTPSCQYCHAAKAFFKENNIEFTEFDVAADAEKRTEMIDKSGQLGVPVIIIGENIIVGFNKNKVAELLGVSI